MFAESDLVILQAIFSMEEGSLAILVDVRAEIDSDNYLNHLSLSSGSYGSMLSLLFQHISQTIISFEDIPGRFYAYMP